MKITSELRSFIEVDNNEAVKIGDLEKNSEAIKVVKPKFHKEVYPNAAVGEGVDELTLREGAGEEGTLRSFITTANVGASRWWPPLVDEDWHATCQAIYNGVEGAEREKLYYKFVERRKSTSAIQVGSAGPGRCGRQKRRQRKRRLFDGTREQLSGHFC